MPEIVNAAVLPAARLRLEDNLCFAIYSANHAFTAAYRPLLAPLGLTYPQYLVLLVLWERDGLSVKAIGRRLHLDSGTLTPLLKRMEEGGVLRRVRDAADERQVRIFLTVAGRDLQAQGAGIQDALCCALGEAAAVLDALRQSVAMLTGRLRPAA